MSNINLLVIRDFFKAVLDLKCPLEACFCNGLFNNNEGYCIFVFGKVLLGVLFPFFILVSASRIICAFKMLHQQNLTRGGQQQILTRSHSDSKDEQMLRAVSTLQLLCRSLVQVIRLWTSQACDKVLYRIMQSTVNTFAQSLHWLRASNTKYLIILTNTTNMDEVFWGFTK